MMTSPGKVARLSRIIDPADDRAVVIAADHGYMLGPIRGVIDLEATIRSVASGGADGILVSPGQAGKIGHLFRGRDAPGLLVRADWTNAFRSKTYTLPSRHVQHRYMTSPRQALALGADAIVIYFFVGYADDREEAEHVRKVERRSRPPRVGNECLAYWSGFDSSSRGRAGPHTEPVGYTLGASPGESGGAGSVLGNSAVSRTVEHCSSDLWCHDLPAGVGRDRSSYSRL